ncbi:MAG: phage holin [Eubacteriales bacterium]|nr:phage holin [Eubacteriales bacterium]
MDNPKHSINADTIARTIILVLALVNQVLAIAGKSVISFADNDIYQMVSLGWTVVASVIAWWKNNSFTCTACEADAWMKAKLEAKKDNKDKEE